MESVANPVISYISTVGEAKLFKYNNKYFVLNSHLLRTSFIFFMNFIWRRGKEAHTLWLKNCNLCKLGRITKSISKLSLLSKTLNQHENNKEPKCQDSGACIIASLEADSLLKGKHIIVC